MNQHKPTTSTITPYQLYQQTLSPSGRKAIASLLTKCAKQLTGESATSFAWHHIKYADVMTLKNRFMQEGYAVSTTNMMLSAIKSIAQTSFNMDLMAAEQLAKIKAVERVSGTSNRKGRGLTNDEILALTTAAMKSPYASKQLRDKAIVLVGCGAGLRSFELTQLTLEDLDLRAGILSVRNGKGRKFRQIHLSRPVLSSIKKWVAVRGIHRGALFCRIGRYGDIHHNQLTTSGVTHLLASLQQTALIAPFSPHDLRRTFITQLLNQGTDMNTVRQLAGHSDITTTARYDCRAETVGQKASKRLSFR